MNKQPIEKRASRTDALDVHSVFYTIQGEGPFCGTPAVFVRLAGCNLQCPGCDTEYTEGRQTVDVRLLVQSVQELMPFGLVVITGGEPFRQELGWFMSLLRTSGYYVQVETNGTLPPPTNFVFSKTPDARNGLYIVCSPKTGKVNPEIWEQACAVKYVIEFDDVHEDGLPAHALRHSANPIVARPPRWWEGPTYLQPMDSKDEVQNAANLGTAVASCLKHGYILQLQIHKLIGVA
jgi:7-carboxy-7-deazaguanine synthase